MTRCATGWGRGTGRTRSPPCWTRGAPVAGPGRVQRGAEIMAACGQLKLTALGGPGLHELPPYPIPAMNPELRPRTTRGAQVETIAPGHWRLTIPAGPAGRYRLAQLDDY